jgi:hypothetical protein
VGSREGVSLSDVIGFLADLWQKYPYTILVSGGADGVDKTAEGFWRQCGGQVESLRPVLLARYPNGDESWGIEKWELGANPRVYRLVNELTWANFKSAAIYRDILIAEASDRVVSFQSAGGSRGASFTAEVAEHTYERPTYRFEAAREAA